MDDADRIVTERIMGGIETANPDWLLDYLGTLTAIRPRISPELFWRLTLAVVLRLAERLAVKSPTDPTPTETRP